MDKNHKTKTVNCLIFLAWVRPMPKKSDSCSGGPLQRGAPCHGIIGIMVNPPLLVCASSVSEVEEAVDWPEVGGDVELSSTSVERHRESTDGATELRVGVARDAASRSRLLHTTTA